MVRARGDRRRRRRVALIADDLVRHFEARLEAMEGKALVANMSRRICVDLYRAIVALRPAWHGREGRHPGGDDRLRVGPRELPAAHPQQIAPRSLAVEFLRKLLNDEVKARSRQNLVQARSFADLPEKSVRRCQNRAIEAAQVIEELIGLAKDMRAAQARGEALGLTSDELAFYDALEINDSAVQMLGDVTLRAIARELVETVRKNVTIDWTVQESVRAKLRVVVKRVPARQPASEEASGGGGREDTPAGIARPILSGARYVTEAPPRLPPQARRRQRQSTR